MRISVSLPDSLIRAADHHAKRSGWSRSQVFAKAISEYLDRRSTDHVTDDMDSVVDELPRERDPFVLAAAYSVLSRVEW
jgi:metal-responsive CopG/Arc/MetJ family transcriptional regulator